MGREGESAMAMYRLLQHSAFGPEDLNRLGAAYERTLEALGLTDRNDPMTELVAKKLLAIHETGVLDPVGLSQRAVQELAH
jgi:hypothetical protein